MKNKKGVATWSISKLLSIILGLVFLSLIVFGLTQGWFKPIFERVESNIDSILITLKFFNKESTPESKTCTELKKVKYRTENDSVYKKCIDGCYVNFTESVFNLERSAVSEIKYNITSFYYKESEYLEWEELNVENINNIVNYENLNKIKELKFKMFLFDYKPEVKCITGTNNAESENILDSFLCSLNDTYAAFYKRNYIPISVPKQVYDIKETKKYWIDEAPYELKENISKLFDEYLNNINPNFILIKNKNISNSDNSLNESLSYIITLDGKYGIFCYIGQDESNSLKNKKMDRLFFVENKGGNWTVDDKIATTNYNIELLKKQRDVYSFVKGICE